MFERFTDRARRVLVLAQDEARLLDHDFIGTEHILLALISEGDGIAAKTLSEMDVSLEEARTEVRTMVGGVGESQHLTSPPFTPRAKKVLEYSLREALQLGHNYIGTEHLLLGVIREGEGVGVQVLRKLLADPIAVREKVMQLLPGHQGPRSQSQLPELEPLCPGCRAPLSQGVRYRQITVSPEGPGGGSLSIDAVYCTRCGVTLEMFKSDPPTGDTSPGSP